MKKTLSLVILTCAVVGWSFGQDAPTVQVAPSDQIVYPDASQILNKTDPVKKPEVAPKTALPSKAPVVAATPVPARPAATAPGAAPAAAPAVAAHGWFLRWTIAGDEAVVKAWVAALGRPVRVAPLGPDQWEALAGPFTGEGLSQALAGQAGLVQLVRR